VALFIVSAEFVDDRLFSALFLGTLRMDIRGLVMCTYASVELETAMTGALGRRPP